MATILDAINNLGTSLAAIHTRQLPPRELRELIAKTSKPPFDPDSIEGAARTFKRAIERFYDIANAQKDDDCDLAVVAVCGGNTLVVRTVAAMDPFMIALFGTDASGEPATLIQHYSQVSIFFKPVPRESGKPRPFGFNVIPDDDDTTES